MIEPPQPSQLELQCGAIFFLVIFILQVNLLFFYDKKTSDVIKMCNIAMRFGLLIFY